MDDSWTLVAAASRNNVIGRSGELPWKLSSDLRRFKRLTMGHCLLMGRKTFESIGRSLPGRQTIVLSRSSHLQLPSDVQLINGLGEVERNVEPGRSVMVVGGAEIYSAALIYCRRIWLTRVLADIEGDTFLPMINWSEWELESKESFEAAEGDDWPTEFLKWSRR